MASMEGGPGKRTETTEDRFERDLEKAKQKLREHIDALRREADYFEQNFDAAAERNARFAPVEEMAAKRFGS
jgi:hypothetical protein